LAQREVLSWAEEVEVEVEVERLKRKERGSRRRSKDEYPRKAWFYLCTSQAVYHGLGVETRGTERGTDEKNTRR